MTRRFFPALRNLLTAAAAVALLAGFTPEEGADVLSLVQTMQHSGITKQQADEFRRRSRQNAGNIEGYRQILRDQHTVWQRRAEHIERLPLKSSKAASVRGRLSAAFRMMADATDQGASARNLKEINAANLKLEQAQQRLDGAMKDLQAIVDR